MGRYEPMKNGVFRGRFSAKMREKGEKNTPMERKMKRKKERYEPHKYSGFRHYEVLQMAMPLTDHYIMRCSYGTDNH